MATTCLNGAVDAAQSRTASPSLTARPSKDKSASARTAEERDMPVVAMKFCIEPTRRAVADAKSGASRGCIRRSHRRSAARPGLGVSTRSATPTPASTSRNSSQPTGQSLRIAATKVSTSAASVAKGCVSLCVMAPMSKGRTLFRFARCTGNYVFRFCVSWRVACKCGLCSPQACPACVEAS